MTARFYDREQDCIWNTADIEAHYNRYFSGLYENFQDYLEACYPGLVWVTE